MSLEHAQETKGSKKWLNLAFNARFHDRIKEKSGVINWETMARPVCPDSPLCSLHFQNSECFYFSFCFLGFLISFRAESSEKGQENQNKTKQKNLPKSASFLNPFI